MARVRVFELLLSHQRRSGLYKADVLAIALERRINLLHQHLAREELLPAEKCMPCQVIAYVVSEISKWLAEPALIFVALLGLIEWF